MESQKEEQNYRMPHNMALQHAWKLAIVEDKEIKSDYWTDSLDKKIIIGVKEDNEKLGGDNKTMSFSPIRIIFLSFDKTEYPLLIKNFKDIGLFFFIFDKIIPFFRIFSEAFKASLPMFFD